MQSADAIRIAVIGLGHVGLPTALGLAELGWQVAGADDDRAKAARIAAGQMPFYEPDAGDLLEKHLRADRFRVAPEAGAAVAASDVVFVCVGTPQSPDGAADLSQVETVARTIARALNGGKLIVEKSTSPLGTAEWIRRTIHRHRNGDHRFEIAVNPEFLREGRAIHDFLHPDRIVLGVESDWAREILLRVYRPLLERLDPSGAHEASGSRVIFTSLCTAELIKHAANAFLATKISFINMIADLCDASGADVAEVARALGLDPRIGPDFLRAGIGFGGYCLPKDLRAFIRIGEEQGVDVSLLESVERINRRRVGRFLQKVRHAVWVARGKTLGVLGLAFKPMTDDVREAPSLEVIRRLLAEGARLRIHDPMAIGEARRVIPEEPERLVYCASPYEVAEGAHALLLLTEWDEYAALDLARLRGLMEVPVIVDGRNLYDPAAVRAAGFEYFAMGRP